MGRYFTVGEFAKLHDLSKQTLIFYDKIDLLKPAYIDENNGYRYYSASQLEVLDTIFMLKEIGVPLSEMKEYLENRGNDRAIRVLKEKKIQLENKIKQQVRIKERLEAKLVQLEEVETLDNIDEIKYEIRKKRYLYYEDVKEPCDAFNVDLAIKEMFKNAGAEKISHNYQIGTIASQENLKSGNFLNQYKCYTILDKKIKSKKCMEFEENLYATFFHKGPYNLAGETYKKALAKIYKDGYEIIGDSYEECIIDNLTASHEADYLTKFSIPIKKM